MRTHYAGKVKESFDTLENTPVTVAGRITAIRKFGKIAFIVLKDQSGEIQLYLSADNVVTERSIDDNPEDAPYNPGFLGIDDGVTLSTKRAAIVRGTAKPVAGTGLTGGTWSVGDRVIHATPAELGTSPNKYVLTGWLCVAAGSPGTWIEQRVFTGT